MRARAAVALLGLAACGRSLGAHRAAVELFASGNMEVLAWTGEPTHVDWTVRLNEPGATLDAGSFGCSVSGPDATTPECTVAIRASTSSLPPQDHLFTDFTPDRPGTYQVQLDGPEGASATRGVIANTRHGDELVRFDRWCGRIGRLASGAWLCDDEVHRGAQPPQYLDSVLAANGPTIVWAFNTGELRRWRDDGTGVVQLEPTSALDLGDVLEATMLLASDDEVIVVHDRGLVRVVLGPGGALVETARAVFPTSQRAIATFVPGGVLTGQMVPKSGLTLGEPELCFYARDGEGFASPDCRREPGWLLAADDGWLWTLDVTRGGRPVIAQGRAPDERRELVLPWFAMINSYSGPMPSLPHFGSMFVPLVDGASVQLRGFPTFLYLTGWGDYAWGMSGTQTVVLAR